jgi:hypothetical protein
MARRTGEQEEEQIEPVPEVPVGDIVKLLMLTGDDPSQRMKSKRTHEVPAAPMTFDILKALPRFKGPFVFSSCGGQKGCGVDQGQGPAR